MDYNKTMRHWFDRFTGSPKNESQCAPHIFSFGDIIETNIGIFSWSMGNAFLDEAARIPSRPKAGSLYVGDNSGYYMSYAASSLDWCDIWDIELAVDITSWKSSISATIQCFDCPGTVAQTVVYGGFLDNDIYRQGLAGTKLNSEELQRVRDAGEDALAEMKALAQANASAPTKASIRPQFIPNICPKQLLTNEKVFMEAAGFWGRGNLTWCTPEDINSLPIIDMNLELGQYLPSPPSREWIALFQAAANNSMQAMIAAVRFDLGNPMPNNPFVNSNIFDMTFAPPLVTVNITTGRVITAQGQLFQNWRLIPPYPYTFPAVPVFMVPYLCTLTVWKSPASAFIAILVATLSISGSAWGLVMLAVTFLVKRNKTDADYCGYHADLASADSGKHSGVIVELPPIANGTGLKGHPLSANESWTSSEKTQVVGTV